MREVVLIAGIAESRVANARQRETKIPGWSGSSNGLEYFHSCEKESRTKYSIGSVSA